MAEVFAGFLCGYTVALFLTPVVAVLLMRWRAGGGLIARLIPAQTSTLGIGVLLHGALFLFWTCAGIVLGLLLLLMEGGGEALGSLNAPFTLFVAGLVLAFSAPVIIVLPRLRVATAVAAIVTLVAFGWLMPYMATWTRFDEAPPKPRERYEVYHVQVAGNDDVSDSEGEP